MLPAPASIAATPRTKSSPSCNPAVPPPPVTGAAVGTKLVAVAPGTVTVCVTVATGLTVAVEVTPGVEGVVPSEAVTVAVPVINVGERLGTVGVEVDPLQAETATGARMVKAPQHRAVSFARNAVPAIVVRTFMGPPHAPGR